VTAALRERWIVLAQRWGARPPSALAGYESIEARYAEPQRRYHTIEHVAEVLERVDELVAVEPVDDPVAVQFAAWLHDVVYDPTRPDNEAASAVYARRTLSMIRVPVAITAEAARLIELTAGHEVAPDDRNGAVLIDADLSILGAPPEVYDRYAVDIRDEYRHVPEPAFRSGRAAILTDFLGRDRLFRTATAHDRWDAAARANLARELDRLR
jgi:predicted metal-dependent HD superfamily phosphohydrolase